MFSARLLVVVVGFAMVSLWDTTLGLRCSMNCANVRCAKPKGHRCEPVMKLCECCPVCASGRGKPCGGIEAPCKKKLWCIRATSTSVEAKRNPKWPDPFRGVCGRLIVHTRWHHRIHHRHYQTDNKPQTHNKHHREWRGRQIFIAK